MFLPLLVAAGAFLASVLSYGLATALMVHLLVVSIRVGRTGPGFWKGVLVLMMVFLITGVMHLAQIALWAVAVQVCGAIPTFEAAFYYSAENYTALGYGDVVLSGQWRLLGPLEAIDGLLLFGVSTAFMFAVMSRLITSRLRSQLGELDEAIAGE